MGQKKGYHPKSEFKKGNKFGELNKGKIPWNKNIPWTEEIKEKIRKKLKGIKRPDVSKRMKGNKIWLGKKHKKESRKKMKINHSGGSQNGYKSSEEKKKKIRISTFEYMKKTKNILLPCIGRNEKQYLDELELSNNIKIIRQHQCEGYWTDGYIKEFNIVFEIDEKPKNTLRDIKREKTIKNKLNCQFLRIKDYD